MEEIVHDSLILGDCMVEMRKIPDNAVDFLCVDLPYGTTCSRWDSVIPIDKLWEQWKRILKHQGAVCLFGSEPFSSKLRMSNMDWYKYDWKWHKTTTTGFQHAKNMPLKDYEDIMVFSAAGMGHKSLLGDNRMTYNPQGLIEVDKIIKRDPKTKFGNIVGQRKSHTEKVFRKYENYPRMTLEYSKDYPNLHPTQKPVELLRYLIRTYSNPGDVVCDPTMGSGTTCVAAALEHRHYIGIEKEKAYYDIACRRVSEVRNNPSLF